MAPVINGMASPLEDRINSILNVVGIIPLVGEVIPPLNLNTSGLLAGAAAGAPVTLSVLDRNGNAVGPSDRCNLEADTLSLAEARGIAIGGNRITGLGTGGALANAGEANAIAFGNGAQTSIAAAGSIAIGHNAAVTASNSVAIGAGATADRGPQLAYAALGLDDDQASAGEFSVGSAGARRQITHVAAGSADDDAVNVAQLQGVADDVQQVVADVTQLADSAVLYDGAARDRITLGGGGGTVVANVAAGQVAAGSSEAVNGAQLFATNQDVADHDTRITVLETRPIGGGASPPGPLRYGDGGGLPNDGSPSDEAILVGASGGAVRVRNVAAGTLADGSADAVNGAQLHATNQDVQANSIAITNLFGSIGDINLTLSNLELQVENNTIAIQNLTVNGGAAGSGPGPVRYADAAQPNLPNGGTPSDDVTFVGASGGPVRVHNVADGRVEAGSNDAVNGGQLHTTNQAVANALAMAESATVLASNSVQYDPGGGSVTFGPGGAPPVVLHNVAAGVAATDAVNLDQLDAGLSGAVTQANAYTDLRIEMLGRDLGQLRRDSNAGTANALAAAALPQAVDAGRGMIAFGSSYYQGQSAFALGLSMRTDDGQAVLRAGASLDTRGRAGLNAGVGFQFQ